MVNYIVTTFAICILLSFVFGYAICSYVRSIQIDNMILELEKKNIIIQNKNDLIEKYCNLVVPTPNKKKENSSDIFRTPKGLLSYKKYVR